MYQNFGLNRKRSIHKCEMTSEKKISRKRLSEEKNCMQHKCNRKLMGKKGEKNPAHQIARKKYSLWPEIDPLPLNS